MERGKKAAQYCHESVKLVLLRHDFVTCRSRTPDALPERILILTQNRQLHADIRAASPVIIYFLFWQLTSRRRRFGGRCNAKKSDNFAASSVRKQEAVVVVATMKRLFCIIIPLAGALMAVQDQPRGQLPDSPQEKYGVVIEMSQGITPDGGAQSILQLRDRLMHNDAPKRVSVSIYRRDCDGLPKLLGNAVICYGGNDEDFDEFRRKLAKAIADLDLSSSHPIPSHPIPVVLANAPIVFICSRGIWLHGIRMSAKLLTGLRGTTLVQRGVTDGGIKNIVEPQKKTSVHECCQ